MSPDEIVLRGYQQECVDICNSLESGSHLVQMATGLGKTVTFSKIGRKGRVLLLSHREELVTQPVRYYSCPVGIEKAERAAVVLNWLGHKLLTMGGSLGFGADACESPSKGI